MISRLSIKSNALGNYKLCNTPIRYKTCKIPRYKWLENDEKLNNNILRAKNTIFEYIKNNKFYFYITLTTNENLIDRYNLKKLINIINEKIKWLRRKSRGNYQYILVPEEHKNGAWHLHGFFSEDFKNDFYINEHNYLNWSSFDDIGFVNIQILYDDSTYLKIANYVTKYINKDFADRKKGDRLYFCSKGLNKSKKILDIIVHNMDSFTWTNENEFCNTKYLNDSEYFDFINNHLDDYYYCSLT